MMEANTNSAATKKNNDIKKFKSFKACFPTAPHKLTQVRWCHDEQLSNCRRDRVEGLGWCGFRSLMFSLTSRLTAGISNRRRVIPTSSSDVWAQASLRPASSLEAKNSTKESSKNGRNVVERCTSEVEKSNVSERWLAAAKVAESGKNDEMGSKRISGRSEVDAGGMGRKIEEKECGGGWWWWDSTGYDLTSVTPFDMSCTLWNELFNSWLTTSTLDDDNDDLQVKPRDILDASRVSSSSSNNIKAEHVTSVSGATDDDELTKEREIHEICSTVGVVADRLNDDSVDWGHHAHWVAALKTTLLLAASHGHHDLVRDILYQQTSRQTTVATSETDLYDLINYRDPQTGNSAVHLAAANGYSSIVSDLISFGADVNVTNKANHSALMVAVCNGRKRCVRVLVQAGCDVQTTDSTGETVLHAAVRYSHAGIIRALIQHNCRLDALNHEGCTALHVAAQLNRVRCLRLLLQHNSQLLGLNTRNMYGQSAVDVARAYHHHVAVALLDKKKMETRWSMRVTARSKAGLSDARRCVVIANNHTADVTTTSQRHYLSRLSLRHVVASSCHAR